MRIRSTQMSLLEASELTPNSKLLTGCGDGLRNDLHHKRPKRSLRAPVPSCRRFATRPPPPQQSDETDVKLQLQKAIEDLAKHPNITRRRALTMAEITPTRSHSRTTDGFQPARGAGGTRAPVAAATRGDAGRRVCQLLLLNAWRRRRAQVATLSDSLGALQTQNGKLELQIDALRRLRQSESDKRNDAVTENQRLHGQIEEISKGKSVLIEEKAALKKDLKMMKEKETQLHLDVENARNDWMTVRCEFQNIEHQLSVERGKIKKTREEKNNLLEKLSYKEQEAASMVDQIDELQEKLLNAELNLQATILSNNAYEDNMKKMMEGLSKETAAKAELQTKLDALTSEKTELLAKMQDLRKSVNNGRDGLKKMDEENKRAQRELAETRELLRKEKEKPWWKNASELAMAPLGVLQNAAYIMLPAIPSTITESTSTTDIPVGLTA